METNLTMNRRIWRTQVWKFNQMTTGTSTAKHWTHNKCRKPSLPWSDTAHKKRQQVLSYVRWWWRICDSCDSFILDNWTRCPNVITNRNLRHISSRKHRQLWQRWNMNWNKWGRRLTRVMNRRECEQARNRKQKQQEKGKLEGTRTQVKCK